MGIDSPVPIYGDIDMVAATYFDVLNEKCNERSHSMKNRGSAWRPVSFLFDCVVSGEININPTEYLFRKRDERLHMFFCMATRCNYA